METASIGMPREPARECTREQNASKTQAQRERHASDTRADRHSNYPFVPFPYRCVYIGQRLKIGVMITDRS